WAFIWIAVTLLLNQISSGQTVLLQATRQIRDMAQAGMIGSFLGLLTSVPLYYYLGIKGIVPAIIISSITTLFLTWRYSRRIVINKVSISRDKVVQEGIGMLKLGLMISLSGLITVGVSYLVRIYITRTGGVEDVGLYN